jgi:hypothetical protein
VFIDGTAKTVGISANIADNGIELAECNVHGLKIPASLNAEQVGCLPDGFDGAG